MSSNIAIDRNKKTIRVVLISAPSEDLATTLAEELVRKNLAACVNVLPGATSYFQWMGKLQSTCESLLICKTIEERLPDLIELVKEMHPYEVPEVIAVAVLEGLPAYCQWIFDCTSKKGTKT